MATATPSVKKSYTHLSPQYSSNTAESYTPFPLVLQQCAPRAVRRHGWAGFVRVAVLILGDFVALMSARMILRGIGDSAWLGGGFARVMRGLVPRGSYPVLPTLSAIVVGLLALGTYGSGDSRRDPSKIAMGVLLALGLMYWSPLWEGGSVLGIVGFFVATLAIAVLVILSRAIIDQIARRYRLRTAQASRTLLVGAHGELIEAWRHSAVRDEAEFNVVGEFDISPMSTERDSGSVGELVPIIQRERVDTVIVVGNFTDEMFDRLVNILDSAGCTVFALPRLLGQGEFEPRLVWRRGQPMIQITRPALRASQLLMKRALDLVAGVSGLLILSPVFAVIAVAIKLDSRGPIFFRQIRVGRGGRLFKILKFRSMVADAELQKVELRNESVYQDARLFKIRRDPRVTKLGAMLRRTSLDELPQLFNVVRGHMSLVGPRPPVPEEVDLYDEHHYARFEMRPGITGPWQVGGRNNITDFDRVIDLEMSYMRHWSIWKDFEILYRTLPAVLRMDGAH